MLKNHLTYCTDSQTEYGYNVAGEAKIESRMLESHLTYSTPLCSADLVTSMNVSGKVPT